MKGSARAEWAHTHRRSEGGQLLSQLERAPLVSDHRSDGVSHHGAAALARLVRWRRLLTLRRLACAALRRCCRLAAEILAPRKEDDGSPGRQEERRELKGGGRPSVGGDEARELTGEDSNY